MFNLETPGYRYSRIANPTTDMSRAPRRRNSKAASAALCVASGQAALHYAFLTLADRGGSIVAAAATLWHDAHAARPYASRQGIEARFARERQGRGHRRADRRDHRAVFCESVGNPAGNICDIEALARRRARRGVPLIVDNTVATPILLRPIEHGADIVVHSLTKFMGGHGVAMGGAIVD